MKKIRKTQGLHSVNVFDTSEKWYSINAKVWSTFLYKLIIGPLLSKKIGNVYATVFVPGAIFFCRIKDHWPNTLKVFPSIVFFIMYGLLMDCKDILEFLFCFIISSVILLKSLYQSKWHRELKFGIIIGSLNHYQGGPKIFLYCANTFRFCGKILNCSRERHIYYSHIPLNLMFTMMRDSLVNI